MDLGSNTPWITVLGHWGPSSLHVSKVQYNLECPTWGEDLEVYTVAVLEKRIGFMLTLPQPSSKGSVSFEDLEDFFLSAKDLPTAQNCLIPFHLSPKHYYSQLG